MMSQNISFWILNEKVVLKSTINECIQKLASIGNHVFVLTRNLNLYDGVLEINKDGHKSLELKQVPNFKLLDIDSCKENLFVVTAEGDVFICDEQLAILSEIKLIENFKCTQGHTDHNNRIKVKCLCVSEYGRLYISENSQLWGSGYMPQVGISGDIPKKINFFSGRTVHNISIGTNFAVIVVSKNLRSEQSETLEQDTFMPNCPKCQSFLKQTMSEPNSSNFICPLGVKINSSYTLENDQIENTNSSDNSEELSDSQDKLNLDKNIIFRNTEAAKDFLSRQISRMSLAGEEYLVCTEKPKRIIRENMNNVATFVYEGVKTVSDKVATLSRHVSASSDCSTINENMNGGNLKDDIFLSGSHSTSEKDISEMEIQGHVEDTLNKGFDILNREVWTWGSMFHRVTGMSEMKKDLPEIISMITNTGVCKISLKDQHACALTLDGRAFIWGQNTFHQVTLENNFDQMTPKLFDCNMDERVRDIICGTQFTVILTNKGNITYFGKGSESYQNLLCKFNYDNTDKVHPCVNLFEDLINTKHFTMLNLGPKTESWFDICLFKEQIMLEEMLFVHEHIIKHFSKKTGDITNKLLYDSLCKTYTDLLHFLCVNVKNLLECRNALISIEDVSIIKYLEEFILIYQSYVNDVQNVASINGFQHISKLVTMSPILYKLKSGILNDQNSKEENMSLILMSPIKHIAAYTDFFRKSVTSDSQLKWKEFVDYADVRGREAEKTLHFWLNSGKNINYLMEPNRRLICDSQSVPITLQNSSRFSSHRFILFSDIFAHINGSSYSTHHLSLIWLEIPHNESLHLICLKMPEETLTLTTVDGVLKNKWYHVLQQAIMIALNKKDLIQPPMARTGTYTFIKSGFWKNATYTGRWSNAKMHGTGKIKWPDGRTYLGQFSNNNLNGYGTMEIPNVGTLHISVECCLKGENWTSVFSN